MFRKTYQEKKVLVTGHTGFKGAWLCEWLLDLGAEVVGYALPPSTSPSLFEQLELAERLTHIEGDIRDFDSLHKVIEKESPDFVFHLAAQPLVRLSYSEPLDTYAVNVMGTVHVLEAVRRACSDCKVVAITTDKCYENREWVHSYREEDPMGGHDPYSSSKGAAELVISSYRHSYFSHPGVGINLASARAGNVIGGGDWALDRIVPDCIRALSQKQKIPVRNKIATRPWQHVLEPLSGYLWLGAALDSSSFSSDKGAFHYAPEMYQGAFNFGPTLQSNKEVSALVEELLRHWPGEWEDRSDPNAVHEAKLLNLSIDKAYHFLGWHPLWDFSRTIEQTVMWYRDAHFKGEEDLRKTTLDQIHTYQSDAKMARVSWAAS